MGVEAPAFRPECPKCGDINFPRALKCASCGTALYLYRHSCIYCGWPVMYPTRTCIGHCDLSDDGFETLD